MSLSNYSKGDYLVVKGFGSDTIFQCSEIKEIDGGTGMVNTIGLNVTIPNDDDKFYIRSEKVVIHYMKSDLFTSLTNVEKASDSQVDFYKQCQEMIDLKGWK